MDNASPRFTDETARGNELLVAGYETLRSEIFQLVGQLRAKCLELERWKQEAENS